MLINGENRKRNASYKSAVWNGWTWPKGSTIKPTHTRHAMHQSKETHWEYKYYPIGNQWTLQFSVWRHDEVWFGLSNSAWTMVGEPILVGFGTPAMCDSHAVFIMGTAWRWWSFLAVFNLDIRCLCNDVHLGDLFIAQLMTTWWRCSAGQLGGYWLFASKTAPATEIGGTGFTLMGNSLFTSWSTAFSALKTEPREETWQKAIQHRQAGADDPCICLQCGPNGGGECPVYLVFRFWAGLESGHPQDWRYPNTICCK